MAEIGIYQDSRQVWIVIAAPFAPSVAMSAQAAGQRVLELVNRARATARRCRPMKPWRAGSRARGTAPT
jgi:hypothetical protein